MKRMDKKNGFYVTLPSNASMPIVLNQPYEVGIIEPQYPRIWTSFSPSDAVVTVYESKTQQTVSIDLSVGFYDSVPRI